MITYVQPGFIKIDTPKEITISADEGWEVLTLIIEGSANITITGAVGRSIGGINTGSIEVEPGVWVLGERGANIGGLTIFVPPSCILTIIGTNFPKVSTY